MQNIDGKNAPQEESKALHRQLIGCLNTDQNVNTKVCDICACHPVSDDKKRTFDSQEIIAKFVKRKTKLEVFEES